MSKQLPLLDKVQPLLLLVSIGIGLSLAWMWPGFSATLVPVVTIGVFLVIYFVMIGVDARGILHAFSRIKPTAVAIGINFIITPVLGWFLGYLFLQDQPEVWVGLILYLITPCIGWYLIFTELAKGDVELGVTLLAWNVLLQIVLMPVYMGVLAGTVIFIDLGRILESVLVFLVAPFLLALATRKLLESKGISVAEAKKRFRLPYLKAITLMLVIIAMFASQGEVLFDNPRIVIRMLVPALAFFLIAFLLALAAGRLFRMTYKEVALLVFTTTARNSEASLAIAVTAFASPLVPLTVVIGPSIELPILILMLRILSWIRLRGFYS